MKKIFIIIYWTIFISISLWVIASFVNVNYTNAVGAEHAPWNFFEIVVELAGE